MTPVIPLPDPLPQPAPPGLLWALLQLTFLLQLIAMNVVLGGSLLAVLGRFSRSAEGALHRAALLAFFARALPVAVAATVTLGVAPLLFVQVLYGRLFFPSSSLLAWFWRAVVPLVILASRSLSVAGRRRSGAGLARLVSALLRRSYLVRHHPRPRPTFVGLTDRREYLVRVLFARYLHVVTGRRCRRTTPPGVCAPVAAWAIRGARRAGGDRGDVFVGLLFLLS
jgi:hypothetical protein